MQFRGFAVKRSIFLASVVWKYVLYQKLKTKSSEQSNKLFPNYLRNVDSKIYADNT